MKNSVSTYFFVCKLCRTMTSWGNEGPNFRRHSPELVGGATVEILSSRSSRYLHSTHAGVKMTLGWSLQSVLWFAQRWCCAASGDGCHSVRAVSLLCLTTNAAGNVNDTVTLPLPSHRSMIFHHSEVYMRDHLGVLEMAVDGAVDHDFWPECSKMLRDARCCAMLFLRA